MSFLLKFALIILLTNVSSWRMEDYIWCSI